MKHKGARSIITFDPTKSQVDVVGKSKQANNSSTYLMIELLSMQSIMQEAEYSHRCMDHSA